MPVSSVKVTGLRESLLLIDEVGDRARNPEPALRASGTRRALQESERRRFSRYRFRPDTKQWQARKRREGLSPRTMVASGRLRDALINANRSEGVIHTVRKGVLTWGIVAGRSPVYYAKMQADLGRKAVAIDRLARVDIVDRLENFIAFGFGAID